MLDGLVSVPSDKQTQIPIRILRDTGAAQSFILADVISLSSETSCGASVLVQGIEMDYVPVPLHQVQLECSLVSGIFRVGVRPTLPVKGIDFILGNDIAGGKIMPVLELLERPEPQADDLVQIFPEVFPACAVTRAQHKKFGDLVNLSDFFPATEMTVKPSVSPSPTTVNTDGMKVARKTGAHVNEVMNLSINRKELVDNQQSDPSLTKCFEQVKQKGPSTKQVDYFLDDNLLMRTWNSHAGSGHEWSMVYQVVLPQVYQQQVLSLAHDHVWAGHLGITKTYDRVLRHFFWPGLKRDVARFCRSCHTCQVAGKPNQIIPPAPLCPIPVLGEPFERVIVDCVGP